MHIAITINSSWNVVNFRSALVSALREDGHDVTVLAPLEPEAAQLISLGCQVIDLEMDRQGLSPLRDFGLLLRMVGHFRRIQPDVVLGYTIKNNIYGAIAARFTSIPFLPNITGLGTAFLGGGWAKWIAPPLYRLALARIPQVFFQNSDDLALFIERGLVRSEQTCLIPGSGIDLAHFTPSPLPGNGRRVTFLMIARILRDKGVLEFVEAAKIVGKRYPEARFQLLGELGADNRTAISSEELAGWVADGTVEYLGRTDDVRAAIVAADCVVLPSYREGAPRTLIEGAAMARPVITTDVPGCRAVIDDGATGLLCQVRNAVDLAEKMISMIETEPAKRTAMGLAGRRKMVKEYDQALVIQAYRDALVRVDAESRRRR